MKKSPAEHMMAILINLDPKAVKKMKSPKVEMEDEDEEMEDECLDEKKPTKKGKK